MLDFRGLNEDAIHKSLIKMGYRAMIAGPFHILALASIVIKSPDLNTHAWAWAGLAEMLAATVIRAVIWKKADRILMLKRGQVAWRIAFGVSCLLIALAWSGTAALALMSYGITPTSATLVMMTFVIASVSAPSFGFDAQVNVAFQIAIVLPLIYGSVAAGLPLAYPAGELLTGTFMCYVAVSIHRAQVESLRNSQTIELQRESLQAAHADIKEAHETVRSMLDSIGEAFLLLDLQGICYNEPSQRAKELLGMDPTGRSVAEIIQPDPAGRDSVLKWYKLLISGQLDFESASDLGPRTLESAARGSTLSLNYNPMRAEDGKLRAVILTAADVTSEVQAKRLADQARDHAQLILKIHENTASFEAFLADFETAAKRVAKWDGKDLPGLRRDLHTMKGSAAMYSATELARAVHEVELALRKLIDTHQPLRDFARLGGSELQQLFAAWQQRNTALFAQLGVFEGDTVPIPRARILELEVDFPQVMQRLLSNDLAELLRSYETQALNTALKLGKRIEFHVENSPSPIRLSPKAYREVFRSLVHLFNNSVDHGIESPEMRRRAGKSETGAIRVSYGRLSREGRDWIRIIIRDDGAGIDIVRLRRSLVDKGDRSITLQADEVVMQRIFDDGVSTRDQVSEVSGQGIGMGAVRAAIEKERGSIRILRSDATGTEFEILLPDRSRTTSGAAA